MVKLCSKCNVEKKAADFYTNKTKKDGLTSQCKSCVAAHRKTPAGKMAQTTYEKTPAGKMAQAKYSQSPKGKIRCARKRIKYYQNHPEKAAQFTPRNYVTKVLKPAILLRDNFTCQHCGKQHDKLVIHHIIPAKMAPDKIKDIDNLITLCKSCHLKVHEGNYRHYDKVWAYCASEYLKSGKYRSSVMSNM